MEESIPKETVLILLLVLLSGSIAYYYWRRSQSRQALQAKPFPTPWQQFLEQHIPLYQLLPADLKPQLHRHINVLMGEKHFEGCDGLTLTDEMKLTITAQAALLLLNRDKVTYFPRLSHILVYPSAYKVERKHAFAGGVEVVETEIRSGESWGQDGILVLSWDDVWHGTQHIGNGHNVVLHEFAHQLDHEDGAWDGTPLLAHKQDYDSWSKYLGAAYTELQTQIKAGRHSVINPYGATNEAEFFAVITEHFFDIPWILNQYYPDLYQELQRYYQVSPLEWFQQVIHNTR